MRVSIFACLILAVSLSLGFAQWSQRSKGLQALNPEIGLLADITALLTESDEDADGNDKLSVRELEFIFGHDVDPYSRFDATVTLSDRPPRGAHRHCLCGLCSGGDPRFKPCPGGGRGAESPPRGPPSLR